MKVYLVIADFENEGEYEDHMHGTHVVSVHSTLEAAVDAIKNAESMYPILKDELFGEGENTVRYIWVEREWQYFHMSKFCLHIQAKELDKCWKVSDGKWE